MTDRSNIFGLEKITLRLVVADSFISTKQERAYYTFINNYFESTFLNSSNPTRYRLKYLDMATKDRVKAAMDKSDCPTRPVDYYYLEAMRYLSCGDHHSDDSDNECECRRCREVSENVDENDNDGIRMNDLSNVVRAGRERSWSHSMTTEFESGAISKLPILDGKSVGGRMKSRRFSEGMLLKPNMKITNGHVQWADECKKELTRFRPRKKYTRNQAPKPTTVKSILKNPSDENLFVPDTGVDEDSKEPPV